MASEYTLQLKATLDTTEVQQKLQQLLNNNALNIKQSNYQGNPIALLSSANYQFLNKINLQLSLINAAILKLSLIVARQSTFLNNNSGFVMRGRANSINGGFISGGGNNNSTQIKTPFAPIVPPLLRGTKEQRTLNAAIYPDEYIKQSHGFNIANLNYVKQNEANLQLLRQNSQNIKWGKAAYGFLVLPALNSAADVADVYDNNGIGTGLRAAGNIGGMAATGAMMGSVIPGLGTGLGAAIGATIGALQSALDAWVLSVKEAKETTDNYAKLLKTILQTLASFKDSNETTRFSNTINTAKEAETIFNYDKETGKVSANTPGTTSLEIGIKNAQYQIQNKVAELNETLGTDNITDNIDDINQELEEYYENIEEKTKKLKNRIYKNVTNDFGTSKVIDKNAEKALQTEIAGDLEKFNKAKDLRDLIQNRQNLIKTAENQVSNAKENAKNQAYQIEKNIELNKTLKTGNLSDLEKTVNSLQNDEKSIQSQLNDKINSGNFTLEEYNNLNDDLKIKLQQKQSALQAYFNLYDFNRSLDNNIKAGRKADESYNKYFEDATFQRNLNNGKYSLLDLQDIYNNKLLKSNYNELKQEVANFQKAGGFEAFNAETKQKALEFRQNNDEFGLQKFLREREALADKYKEQSEKLINLSKEFENLSLTIENYKKALEKNAENASLSLENFLVLEILKKNNQAFENYMASGKNEQYGALNNMQDLRKIRSGYLEKRDFYKDKYQKELTDAMNSGNLEDLQKHLENALKILNKANNFDALANQTTGFMLNLANSIEFIKPDMAQVQSLGQYGFNMGEKNDNVERMNQYFDDSLACLQTIRDLLQEDKNDKYTVATFQ